VEGTAQEEDHEDTYPVNYDDAIQDEEGGYWVINAHIFPFNGFKFTFKRSYLTQLK
jgi:hypothetical protein